MNRISLSGSKEAGAVLIVALVILLILTILGLAVMESSIIEERSAGNALTRNAAFQAAEAALEEAETILQNLPQAPEPVDAAFFDGSVYDIETLDGGNPRWWEGDESIWTLKGTLYDVDGDADPATAGFAGTSQDPYYMIEEYDEVCDELLDPKREYCKTVYQVTAIAWSGRNYTVILQSLFAWKY